MTTTSYYAIDDGDGNEITTGLPEETARETAQRMANDRGVPVYLYEVTDGEDEVESEEIAPEESA